MVFYVGGVLFVSRLFFFDVCGGETLFEFLCNTEGGQLEVVVGFRPLPRCDVCDFERSYLLQRNSVG